MLRPLPTRALLGLGALGAALTVGCARPASEASTSGEALVEGNLEPTRHPAVGYLVMKLHRGPHAGTLWRPN